MVSMLSSCSFSNMCYGFLLHEASMKLRIWITWQPSKQTRSSRGKLGNRMRTCQKPSWLSTATEMELLPRKSLGRCSTSSKSHSTKRSSRNCGISKWRRLNCVFYVVYYHPVLIWWWQIIFLWRDMGMILPISFPFVPSPPPLGHARWPVYELNQTANYWLLGCGFV